MTAQHEPEYVIVARMHCVPDEDSFLVLSEAGLARVAASLSYKRKLENVRKHTRAADERDRARREKIKAAGRKTRKQSL